MDDREKEALKSLQGGQVLRRAMRLFEVLRDAGTERDVAGNRRFFFSQYAGLVLLGHLNPALNSLNALQRASECEHVQRLIGGGRVSRGSLSESVRVFDPALLEPLVRQLIAELPAGHPGPGPHRALPESIPEELARRLVAADGSVLRVLPQIVSSAMRSGGEGWRMHLQFRPLDGSPGKLVVTPDGIGGDADERRVLERTLEAGCVYVCDRGYEKHALFRRIVEAGSDYVIRGQDRPVEVVESRPLAPEAVEARVVSDDLVILGQGGVGHPVRRVVVDGRERGRQRSDRRPSDAIVLWTNLVDVPAEVIALVYEQRWTIELFFRFLKHVLGCRRLLTDKPEGVAIQIYVALIACLLLASATGGNVGKVEMELFQMYLSGWSTEAELLAGLSRHRAARERARARAAARR